MLFYRTAEPISTNFGTKHPWVRGVQVSSHEKKNPINYYKVNNGFLIFSQSTL